MGIPKEMYFVWEEEVKNEEHDVVEGGYFHQFNNAEDAVSEFPDSDLFKGTMQNLGRFELQTKLVKLKKSKGNK